MTTADQMRIVEAKLARLLGSGPELGLKGQVLAEGGLIQGWVQSRRLVVVVGVSSGQYALVIFTSQTFPVGRVEDLAIDDVIPVDKELKCEIESGDAVLVNIKSGSSTKIMLEMLPGYHTQNFVAEIYRLTDLMRQDRKVAASSPSSETWLNQLRAAKTTDEALSRDLAQRMRVGEGRDTPTLDASPIPQPRSGSGRNTALVDLDADDDSPNTSLNRQEIALGGAAPIAARESVVKYQMALKEEQFTHKQTFTVFCGTWNVNGQSPISQVKAWLAVDEDPPDIYAIGFQELDLSKEAFVFNESIKEDEWQAIVFASLHPQAKYKRVKLVRLVGMMLIVFAKSTHMEHIHEITSETVGTGIMGKLGNKGGVAVRFEFHNTSICFVNSHLAAHVSEFERRNQDYHDICARMVFQNFVPTKSIKDHDQIFWLGDLNYRITDLDTATVKELLQENNIPDLLLSDQFLQQRKQRRVFTGYKEGDITFIPTYKFDPGTDMWDTSEKARAPAWTDRILWRGDYIEQIAYRSHMELKVSDHKPVSAVFKAGVKVIDPVKYRKIYEDVMKKLDRLENEFLPQVTVENTEIIFDGKVQFLETYTKTLTVANTGQVPVQYEFIKKLNDTSICKAWLTVEPSTGFIMPGEKSDIALELHVDKTTAGPLNAGADQMYDILVLHLVGGKDIFITVSGEYQKSCFGASINALCQMTVPISELSVGALMDLEKPPCTGSAISIGGEEPYPVPKELWFLCDLITSLGLDQEQLFLQPGLRKEILAIRDWLDTGLPVDKPDVSIHSAAETLLLFLESLREPILPFTLYGRCLDVSSNYLQCKQVISQLPQNHKNVFNYMTAFLREVIRHSAQNGIDPKIMATLFAGIFLRDPPGTNFGSGLRAKTNQQLLDHRKARFVHHFLINEPDD
ncbi:hypothetical protein TCAL_09197 [Tigriopus californicus]|uniref:phosphoinositide 5-phosphatase n=1 Tax=Tigriopus californicus TaxID=6832 RepID=A0A553PAR4_TIGCA|nr:inositol polyphosphate 5-phosphatase OCRL-like [Tigriopus californicus]TRY74769.1 hypothetical protein TCAL_09197 [Tigriopus californicus]|eukprot:TCALIF_09197-PA protein Name:"Similar to Ocrl Inositol polyphosphate 5-phosphatase OCRL-1 (Rattus norvegicus)" AED:0.00 eAED:0.00 QI:349/1/1/1/1/1/3/204/909